MMNIEAFKKECMKQWGDENRIFPRDIRKSAINDFIPYLKLSTELKIHMAKMMICESCSIIGSSSHNSDPPWFLYNLAFEMKHRKGVFDDRMSSPIKSALILISAERYPDRIPGGVPDDLKLILQGGHAVGSLYLLSQLEFLFRAKSKYLNWDGSIKEAIPDELWDKLKTRKGSKQINQIGDAFQIYVFNNNEELAVELRDLDTKLKSMFSGKPISERLNYIRHRAMHGSMPDISSEGLFYGLLMAMCYHAEFDDPNYKYTL